MGIFAFATYMQLFTVALGRFNRELIKPYIYLIPEPPLKKLLYAIQESMLTNFWEAVLIFVIVGAILQASPLEIALCILARVSFALLFTAGNVLVERVFGHGFLQNADLLVLLYRAGADDYSRHCRVRGVLHLLPGSGHCGRPVGGCPW